MWSAEEVRLAFLFAGNDSEDEFGHQLGGPSRVQLGKELEGLGTYISPLGAEDHLHLVRWRGASHAGLLQSGQTRRRPLRSSMHGTESKKIANRSRVIQGGKVEGLTHHQA